MMMYDGMMEGSNQAIYGNAIRVLGGNIQIHAAGNADRQHFPWCPSPTMQVVEAVCHLDVTPARRSRPAGCHHRGALGEHHRHRAKVGRR
jgi:hypothetical protein